MVQQEDTAEQQCSPESWTCEKRTIERPGRLSVPKLIIEGFAHRLVERQGGYELQSLFSLGFFSLFLGSFVRERVALVDLEGIRR